MMPLYGFLEGDTMGLLVLVDDHGTVADLVRDLNRAAACRVAPRHGGRVLYKGHVLDPTTTLAAAGFSALDLFVVLGEG